MACLWNKISQHRVTRFRNNVIILRDSKPPGFIKSNKQHNETPDLMECSLKFMRSLVVTTASQNPTASPILSK